MPSKDVEALKIIMKPSFTGGPATAQDAKGSSEVSPDLLASLAKVVANTENLHQDIQSLIELHKSHASEQGSLRNLLEKLISEQTLIKKDVEQILNQLGFNELSQD